MVSVKTLAVNQALYFVTPPVMTLTLGFVVDSLNVTNWTCYAFDGVVMCCWIMVKLRTIEKDDRILRMLIDGTGVDVVVNCKLKDREYY